MQDILHILSRHVAISDVHKKCSAEIENVNITITIGQALYDCISVLFYHKAVDTEFTEFTVWRHYSIWVYSNSKMTKLMFTQ